MAKHFIISNQQIQLIRTTLGPLPGLACDPIVGVLDQLRPYDQGIVTSNDATGDADLDHLTSMVKEIHEAIVNPAIVTEPVLAPTLPLKPRTLKFEDQENTEEEDDAKEVMEKVEEKEQAPASDEDEEAFLDEVESIGEDKLEESTSVDIIIPVKSDAGVKRAQKKMKKVLDNA